MTVFMNQSNSSWRSMCFLHCSSGSKRLAAPPHGRKRNARRLVFASCQRIHLLDAKPPTRPVGAGSPEREGDECPHLVTSITSRMIVFDSRLGTAPE